MKYKILVLDLDGTLTNDKKEITPRTLEVLERAQRAGVKLVLASGRPTYGITPLAKELKMDQYGGYILSFNGGKIIDAKSMEVLYAQTLPQSLVPSLYGEARAAGAVILSYRDESILTEEPKNRYVEHESFLTKMEAVRVEEFCQAINFDPDKCLIVGEAEQLIPLVDHLNAKFGEQLSAYRSEPFFLEVVPKGIDKALSLRRLLEHMGCGVSDMVAVGDGYNDLSMIRLAGFGVAMANAQEEVKQVADYITLSNEEDGVAELVERYIL
ncbi:MAG: Cof-type HAD-IIB family hydrolase [Rikenellaceae bacterium]